MNVHVLDGCFLGVFIRSIFAFVLQVKLSAEHQGFAFEKYPDVAITLLQHHSGGKCSEALKMATALRDPI
jgi:hypothetical protein